MKTTPLDSISDKISEAYFSQSDRDLTFMISSSFGALNYRYKNYFCNIYQNSRDSNSKKGMNKPKMNLVPPISALLPPPDQIKNTAKAN